MVSIENSSLGGRKRSAHRMNNKGSKYAILNAQLNPNHLRINRNNSEQVTFNDSIKSDENKYDVTLINVTNPIS